MTQEDKELLQRDLCARLPYGVKIETEYFTKATLVAIRKNISYGARKDLLVTYDISGEETPYQSEERSSTISKIKPYLFPLSSMSEEQKKYINDRWGVNEDFDFEIDPNWGRYFVDLGDAVGFINWCYENHYDINGLIPRGLAEDATDKNIY